MNDTLVQTRFDPPIATITLNDPARRNAMSIAMFDALDDALAKLREEEHCHIVLMHGNGKAFCAGFDLSAAVEDPKLLEAFIHRLSTVIRNVRRLPQVVVASVHGAAIAGGCALISACDFVVAEDSTKIGYPVHRIGISPAVSAPTLMQKITLGAARELMMSGRLINGREAHRMGLASHHCADPMRTLETAKELCQTLAEHGPQALRVTRRWINELDGSLDDARFDGPAQDTGREALEPGSVQLLRDFWASRSR